jgi:transposase-like protein
MKKQRKHYTPEEKVAILRRHLLEQVPISELCDKHGPSSPRSSTADRRSSSRMGRLPFGRKSGPTIQPSRSGSPTWRRRSRPRTRS